MINPQIIDWLKIKAHKKYKIIISYVPASIMIILLI